MLKAIFSAAFSIVYWVAVYLGIDWVKRCHESAVPLFRGGSAMELSILAVAMTAMAFAVANNRFGHHEATCRRD
jgi:hypothetical protein